MQLKDRYTTKNEMKVKYVLETRDGKIVDHIEEIAWNGDRVVTPVPVRELPSGRRTIRPE